jgi:hypothetical protein
MENGKEINAELKEEVNKLFADLFKEIGNNRVQLSNQVFNVQHEINKELNRDKVDAARRLEILAEFTKAEKMAAKQLPHLKRNIPKLAGTAPEKKIEKKPSQKSEGAEKKIEQKIEKKPEPKAVAKPEKKPVKATEVKSKKAVPVKKGKNVPTKKKKR